MAGKRLGHGRQDGKPAKTPSLDQAGSYKQQDWEEKSNHGRKITVGVRLAQRISIVSNLVRNSWESRGNGWEGYRKRNAPARQASDPPLANLTKAVSNRSTVPRSEIESLGRRVYYL